MAKNDTYVHWRDSALTPKFFMIDAKASFAILLLLLRPNIYTVIITVLVVGVLVALNHYKIPLSASFRMLRQMIVGPKKYIGKRR